MVSFVFVLMEVNYLSLKEGGGGMAAAASGGMRGAKSISIFLKIQTSKRLGRSTTIYVPTRLPTYPFQVGYLPVDSSHLPSIHPA